MLGRLDAPKFVGRLSPSGEAGSRPLEKCAELDPKLVGEGVLKAINFAKQHPAVTGAAIGGLVGAVRGGGSRTEKQKADDPNGGLRGRALSTLGGIGGGALVGDFVGRNMNHPMIVPLTLQQIVATGRSSLGAGRAVSEAMSPSPKIPESLTSLLGPKKRYTEKDVFNKYQQDFGDELKSKGPEGKVHDIEHEARFINALKDIYQEGEAGNARGEPVAKKQIVKERALALGAAVGMAAVPALFGFVQKSALLPLLPTAIHHVAGAASSIRHHHEPAVQVSKEVSSVRGKFNDDQLRRLLRGLGVEEVREHAIK